MQTSLKLVFGFMLAVTLTAHASPLPAIQHVKSDQMHVAPFARATTEVEDQLQLLRRLLVERGGGGAKKKGAAKKKNTSKGKGTTSDDPKLMLTPALVRQTEKGTVTLQKQHEDLKAKAEALMNKPNASASDKAQAARLLKQHQAQAAEVENERVATNILNNMAAEAAAAPKTVGTVRKMEPHEPWTRMGQKSMHGPGTAGVHTYHP